MILLLDNYDSFTWNLVDLIARAAPRAQVRVVRNDEWTPAQVRAAAPSHVIVSPGPRGPVDAGVCVGVVRDLSGHVPILGVCLGLQCIGAAFGMNIERAPEPVHGWTCDVHHDGRTIFAGLPTPLRAMRYHSLVVGGAGVPAGWEVSAHALGPSGEVLVMGLRRARAGASVEGVQFHPESFMTEGGQRLMANFLGPLAAPTRAAPV